MSVPSQKSTMRRVLTEPFFQFAVLGVLIFFWFNLVQTDEWTVDPESRVIVLDQRQLDLLALQFEETWRRPPSEEEFYNLKEDWLNREILYREALALGLDGNDEIIRNRLVQKMNFLLVSEARALRPTDEVLTTYLSENTERFTIPVQVAASLVHLGQNPSEDYVEQILDELKSGADHSQLGQASLLPSDFGLSVRTAIDGSFGNGFFDQLDTLPLEQWNGPVRSSFGYHLVRLGARTEAVLPSLDDVRDKVLAEWQASQAELATQTYLDTLRSAYTIREPQAVDSHSDDQ